MSGPDHLTSRITRSFLSGTEDWRSIGTSAVQDPYLSRYGGIALTFRDASDRFYANIDQIGFTTPEGTNYLEPGPGVVFYTEWLLQQQHEFHIAIGGNDIPVRYNASAGGFKPLSVKMRPVIYRVQPAAGLPLSRTLSLAPGSLISIFGDGFSPVAASAGALPLPVELAGVSAYVNGTPLGLLYVGPYQVNAYLPQGISGLATLTVRTSSGQHSTNIMMSQAVPAIFTQNGAGKGIVAAVNAITGVPVTDATPANEGDLVSLFVTGLGATARSGQLDSCVLPPTVAVGSTYAKVLFAGLAPGYIGLYQINFQVPAEIQSGSAVPIAVKSGKYWSNAATIPIR